MAPLVSLRRPLRALDGLPRFILSRVREAVDRGGPTEVAVRRSIALTAGVVTAAAVVMVCVFALFGTLSSLELKQAGVGLAAAVLIDATLIRGVLLPATMNLLGDWNWYLPRQLHGSRDSPTNERLRRGRALNGLADSTRRRLPRQCNLGSTRTSCATSGPSPTSARSCARNRN